MRPNVVRCSTVGRSITSSAVCTRRPAVGDAIEAGLDAIAASGAAIELNTDRFSDPAGVMYPSEELLRAVGGRGTALVISSDAHAAEHVGQPWDEATLLPSRRLSLPVEEQDPDQPR
jgi:HisJ family histidinol phosphate phosphatase